MVIAYWIDSQLLHLFSARKGATQCTFSSPSSGTSFLTFIYTFTHMFPNTFTHIFPKSYVEAHPFPLLELKLHFLRDSWVPPPPMLFLHVRREFSLWDRICPSGILLEFPPG